MLYYIFPLVFFIAFGMYVLMGKADAILRELKSIREKLEK